MKKQAKTRIQISISMDEDLLKQVDAYAKKQQRTRSNAILYLLREILKTRH